MRRKKEMIFFLQDHDYLHVDIDESSILNLKENVKDL